MQRAERAGPKCSLRVCCSLFVVDVAVIVVADLNSAVIVVLAVAVVVVLHYTRRLCVSQRDEWDADERGVREHVARLDLNFEASVAWVE